jgi:hypothetical protein
LTYATALIPRAISKATRVGAESGSLDRGVHRRRALDGERGGPDRQRQLDMRQIDVDDVAADDLLRRCARDRRDLAVGPLPPAIAHADA